MTDARLGHHQQTNHFQNSFHYIATKNDWLHNISTTCDDGWSYNTTTVDQDVRAMYKTSHYYLNPSFIEQDHPNWIESSRRNDHPKIPSSKPSNPRLRRFLIVMWFGTKRPKSGKLDFSSKIGLCYFVPNNTLNHCTKN